MQEDDAEVDEELRRQHAASETRGPGGALTIGQLARRQLLLAAAAHRRCRRSCTRERCSTRWPIWASAASAQAASSQGGGSQRQRALGDAPRGPPHALLSRAPPRRVAARARGCARRGARRRRRRPAASDEARARRGAAAGAAAPRRRRRRRRAMEPRRRWRGRPRAGAARGSTDLVQQPLGEALEVELCSPRRSALASRTCARAAAASSAPRCARRRHAAAAAADAQLRALDAQLLARLCAIDARDGGGGGGSGVAATAALAAYLDRLARDAPPPRRSGRATTTRRKRAGDACAVGRAAGARRARPAAADALRRIFDECEPHERAAASAREPVRLESPIHTFTARHTCCRTRPSKRNCAKRWTRPRKATSAGDARVKAASRA